MHLFFNLGILHRLQEKIPKIIEVSNAWHLEAARLQAETGESEDKSNYLLCLTQILSFYLTYFPEKFSPADLDIGGMLEKIEQIPHENNWLVQLHLLKHLMASQNISRTHLNTLLKIACQNFDDENGELAMEAVLSLLQKHDLCHHKTDLKIWLGKD